MAGLAIALLLLASLLLVHFSLRRQPLPPTRPLDVDSGLPLPELGQASTVFSLTALFGAYLGIHLLLGLPAVLGLGTGTAAALVSIRRWMESRQAQSFDDFLFTIFGNNQNSMILALCLAAMQCAYASSELLILRSISDLSLGLRADHAFILAVSVGVIAYFYVLFGGYMAVFRTDVLQFIFVAAMGFMAVSLSMDQFVGNTSTSLILPRDGYWEIPWISSKPLLYAYHFFLGGVMGLGFILSSPDAWKRIYLVTSGGQGSKKRFAIFAIAGTAPFLLLVLVDKAAGAIPDGPMNPASIWAGLLTNNILYVSTFVALVASFLSAFNGALLSSVHVGLVAQRRLSSLQDETARFHWLMAASLLTIFSLFAGLCSLDNPYLLANLLLGPYAVVSAIIAGSRGNFNHLISGSVLWIVTIGFSLWALFLASELGFSTTPTTYQINTVPGGVLLFILVFIVCKILSARSKNDRS